MNPLRTARLELVFSSWSNGFTFECIELSAFGQSEWNFESHRVVGMTVFACLGLADQEHYERVSETRGWPQHKRRLRRFNHDDVFTVRPLVSVKCKRVLNSCFCMVVTCLTLSQSPAAGNEQNPLSSWSRRWPLRLSPTTVARATCAAPEWRRPRRLVGCI